MTLSLQEQRYLQRLVADRPSSRKTGAVAGGLSAKLGLGQMVGNVIFYKPDHLDQAQRLTQLRPPIAGAGIRGSAVGCCPSTAGCLKNPAPVQFTMG